MAVVKVILPSLVPRRNNDHYVMLATPRARGPMRSTSLWGQRWGGEDFTGRAHRSHDSIYWYTSSDLNKDGYKNPYIMDDIQRHNG